MTMRITPGFDISATFGSSMSAVRTSPLFDPGMVPHPSFCFFCFWYFIFESFNYMFAAEVGGWLQLWYIYVYAH